MTTLKTGRLCVQVCDPGEFPNTTYRFDRAAFIPSVILDGRHEFAVTEPINLPQPTTGGVGMCNEIRDTIWEKTPVGGKTPKFGIGLFTKPSDEPYIFYKSYEVEPFDITVTRNENTVIFDTAPKLCMGYALHEKKVLTVCDNTIAIDYLFENVGEKELALEEYCHNFMSIDGHPTSEKYYLSLPAACSLDGRRANAEGSHLIGRGNGITFDGHNTVSSIIDIMPEDIKRDKPFSWTLSHGDSPVTVTEQVSFAPAKVPVWSFEAVISTEVYNRFTLSPGASITYGRKWTFNN